jgi:hypothetical protein
MKRRDSSAYRAMRGRAITASGHMVRAVRIGIALRHPKRRAS